MKPIYDYHNYRHFIRDYYESHKATDSAFSLRYLSEKAGVNSSAYFKFLIDGKRNLTKSSILKVAGALNLSVTEAEYFELLVFFNQAKTILEKNRYFELLIEHRKTRHFLTIGESQFDYFSKWYHPVIRELVCMDGFNNNWIELAKSLDPPITPKEARASVKLLLKLGFVSRQPDRYIQSNPVLSTGNSLDDHRIINYQIAMLQHAIAAFDRSQPRERFGSSTTCTLSESDFARYCDKIRELRRDILENSKTRGTESPRVYQLTVNMFPLSRDRARNS